LQYRIGPDYLSKQAPINSNLTGLFMTHQTYKFISSNWASFLSKFYFQTLPIPALLLTVSISAAAAAAAASAWPTSSFKQRFFSSFSLSLSHSSLFLSLSLSSPSCVNT
jgi:hypothetical protein